MAAPAGHYQAKLTAWDLAGNTGEAQPAVFQVNEATQPSAAVPQSPATDSQLPVAALKYLSMKETPAGSVVWMPATDLFVEDGLDPPLKPTAWDSLNELSHLIQTYPDWTCLIEGYSHRRSAPGQDMDLSSSWAWRVYGALVKSGVSAKRLDVRGRGRGAGVSSSDKSFNGIVVTLTKSQQGTP